MSAAILFREFAAICAAAYDAERAPAFGRFTRLSPMQCTITGFQGAIYRRRTEGGAHDWVVGVAGTQGLGVDAVTDAGFGGSITGVRATAALSLSPLIPLAAPAAMLSITGCVLLGRQCAAAEDLIASARGAMAPGDRLVVTGHSLGGGIAQIMAARTGVPAVAISSPAVTAVSDIVDDYERHNRPPIVCLRVRHDPINNTGLLGSWLGSVVLLPSPRTGGAAHSINGTVDELSPSGAFSAVGSADPFARV